MSIYRKIFNLFLNVLIILTKIVEELLKVIEFIFSSIKSIFSKLWEYIFLPGILIYVALIILLLLIWALGYIFLHTSDFVDKNILKRTMIILECSNKNTKIKMFQVYKYFYSDDPYNLKTVKRVGTDYKLIRLAKFSKNIENDDIYQFDDLKKVYNINRKNLKIKIYDKKNKSFKLSYDCKKIDENELNEFVIFMNSGGKKF